MFPTPTKCHVCGNNEIEVSRLICPSCGTVTEGRFIPSSNPFAGLNDDQVQFLLAFVRNEGKLNRLEDELNMSYPTLRNRLSELISALGYEPVKEEIAPRLTTQDRSAILEQISNGTLSVEEAQVLLRGKEAAES